MQSAMRSAFKPIIKMKRAEFISEHTKLVKILKKGNKGELLKEAREQQEELNNYL